MNHRTIAMLAALLLCHAASAFALNPNRIPAKAAVVLDENGAVLFGKFPNAKLAPASTVKLVTAMVVLDRMDPDAVVTVGKKAARTKSIPPRLHANEAMTVTDLLHLALIKSVNSAAVALAEATAGSESAFAGLMNEKAREIGARDTLFANASGLPEGVQYTTPTDLALIMKAALSYPLIREILGKKSWFVATTEGRIILIENSNDLLWRDENVIAGKTGYTGNARHCFVAAINTDQGVLYTAVMGARSRSSLWKSTLLLAEIGARPEMALASAKSRVRHASLKMH